MAIAKLADDIKRRGETVYSLGIGDTHFPPPKLMREGLINAITNGKTHYTEAKGIPEFRKSIADYYSSIYHPDEIIVSSGLKEALYVLLLSMNVKKVCVVEPAWLGYQATCTLTGKQYEAVTYHDSDWLEKLGNIDFDVLLICLPNNPDGKIFDAGTLQALKEIVERKGAYIIVDEIYRLYDYRVNPENGAAIFYGMPKAIIANGLSKSHGMTGLRIGFLLTKDSALMTRMVVVQQNLSTCANSIGQFAGIGFVDALGEVESYKNYYKANRDLVVDIIPALKAFLPEGGFYFFFDLKVFGRSNADEFCKDILNNARIGLVPGSAYGSSFNDWVRLSFSVDRDLLKEAVKKLDNYLNEN